MVPSSAKPPSIPWAQRLSLPLFTCHGTELWGHRCADPALLWGTYALPPLWVQDRKGSWRHSAGVTHLSPSQLPSSWARWLPAAVLGATALLLSSLMGNWPSPPVGSEPSGPSHSPAKQGTGARQGSGSHRLSPRPPRPLSFAEPPCIVPAPEVAVEPPLHFTPKTSQPALRWLSAAARGSHVPSSLLG